MNAVTAGTTAHDERGHAPSPAARLGLWLFMMVVTVLFLQFLHAYIARMDYADWRPLPTPWTAWLNTLLLALGSAALQWARVAARRGWDAGLRAGLLAGGILAFAFLAGQLWLWQQLGELDYRVASNPANSFFYMLTGLHGLHLLGGLVAWGKTATRVWRGAETARVRVSVELCAVYWHFLLAVWLVLFGLLFLVPPATIQAICRSF